MAVKVEVLKEREHLIGLRRWFHQHPEAAHEEFKTTAKIAEELEKWGIEYEYLSPTAIAGKIIGKKGAGKVIALRSDTDALKMEDLKDVPYASKHPGLCHACGHDAHTATLLVAAKVLKEKEAEFAGEVRLFFQPAEEVGGGADFFVDQGYLKNVDRAFGIHVASRFESGKVAITEGPVQASSDFFEIQVTGRGAHASTPEQGIDALYIASQIVVSLQSIVSRNTAPTDTAIVGVGVLEAGTQYNIVAEHARLEGTVRAFTMDHRNFTNQRIEDVATQTAALFGGEAKVRFSDFAPPVVNDPEATKEAQAIAEAIFGAENVITNQEKSLGADDFSMMMNKTKGVFAYVGTHHKDKPNTGLSHHHGLFDIDEDTLLAACQLYVDFALLHLK